MVGCSFEFNRNFYEAPPPRDGTGTEDTGTGTADTETNIEDTGPGDTGTGTINTGTETADTGTGNGITSATLKHRWRFNGNLIDEVGGSDAVITPVGAKDVSFSETETEIVLTGGRPENVPGWVSLGSQLITDIDGPATLEIFATTYSIQYFSRILDFGANEDNYLTMTWTGNSNILSEDVVGWWWDSVVKDSLKNNTNAPYNLGGEYHIVMTFDPTGAPGGNLRISWHTAPSYPSQLHLLKNDNGGPGKGGYIDPSRPFSDIPDVQCWIGKSHKLTSDWVANASFNDVRIWDGIPTAQELETLHELGPDADL